MRKHNEVCQFGMLLVVKTCNMFVERWKWRDALYPLNRKKKMSEGNAMFLILSRFLIIIMSVALYRWAIQYKSFMLSINANANVTAKRIKLFSVVGRVGTLRTLSVCFSNIFVFLHYVFACNAKYKISQNYSKETTQLFRYLR